MFFNLPEDKKKEVLHVPGPSLQRGWSMVGSEITSNLQSQEKGASKDEDKLDQKVSLMEEKLKHDNPRLPTNTSQRNILIAGPMMTRSGRVGVCGQESSW